MLRSEEIVRDTRLAYENFLKNMIKKGYNEKVLRDMSTVIEHRRIIEQLKKEIQWKEQFLEQRKLEHQRTSEKMMKDHNCTKDEETGIIRPLLC